MGIEKWEMLSRPEGSSGSSSVSDLARGIAHMDTCTHYIFSKHACKILQICIAKTADNIQYTSIYINIHQHTITVLAYYKFLIHDSTLSGGAARDFQVTTGTRIVEASTAGVSYTSPRH